MRALLAFCTAVMVVIAACAPDSPTTPSGLTPIDIEASLGGNCAGDPRAGGVSHVYAIPALDTLRHYYVEEIDTFTVQVFRDDQATSGIQDYCQDFSVNPTWSRSYGGFEYQNTSGGINGGTTTPAQKAIVKGTGVGRAPGGFAYAIVTYSGKIDTVKVKMLF